MAFDAWLWRAYSSLYPTVTTSYPYKEMMREVGRSVQKGSKVVDVGCGTGGLMAYLPEIEAYTGIDSEPEMIAQARMTAGELWSIPEEGKKRPQTQFITASVFDLGDWPECNAVVMCNSFYTMDERLRALRIVYEHLPTNGYLVLCDPDGSPHIGAVLKEHFAKYREEHGRLALHRHRVSVIIKLAMIVLINRMIFKRYTFLSGNETQNLLNEAGFRIGTVIKTYADQNLLIVAFKTW